MFDHRDMLILKALRDQDQKLEQIKRGQSWWLDLSSNVAGNIIYEGAAYLLRGLMKKL